VPVEPLAHLLLGATLEGAMLIGRSSDPERARQSFEVAMGRVLDGLRTYR
jgi:hypothetical protein